MKKFIIKKTVLSLYFIIASLAIEMITFPAMDMSVGVLPKYFLIDLSFVIAIASILFLFPLKIQEIIQATILSVESIIMVSNASLYLSRGDIFDWSLIKQIGQLTEVSDMIKIPGWSLAGSIILIIGYISLSIFIRCKKEPLKKFHFLILLSSCSLCLIVSSCFNIFIHQKIKRTYTEDKYYISDCYMFDTFASSYSSLQKFGFYGYYFEDFVRIIIPSFKPKAKEITPPKENYNYTSILDGICEDNNVIMFYAESFDIYGISKELTPVLYSLKNGADLSENGIEDFYNVTQTNGKTNISRKDFNFDGSNYTFNGTDIYKNLTIGEVGLSLNKYISCESTNTSEMKALTGYGWDTNYTLPKMLNDYQSTYIHGNAGDFYNRTTRMENAVGFNTALFVEDMADFAVGELQGLNYYSLDSETLRHYTDDPAKQCFPVDEKFFTFFMSITTHGPYSYTSYLDANYAFVDAVAETFSNSDLFRLYNQQQSELKLAVREYFARVLDTEYSIAYIVNYLHKNNILNSTIITFTGDHNAYSNDIKDFKQQYVETCLNEKHYSYTNVIEGFIYSTQIKNSYLKNNNETREISHLTESTDLAPTILTLLGKEFTQDVFMGSCVINKSVENPDATIYNQAMRSYTQGIIENDYLETYDGTTIKSKDLSLTISQQEYDDFSQVCNKLINKYYIVGENRNT